MLRKGLLTLTVAYTIALAILSLIRLNKLPSLGINFADKIFHFIAYAILTILWFYTFLYIFKLTKKVAIFFAATLAIVFGMLIEVLQGTATDFRAFDFYDALANTLGALLVSVVLWFRKDVYIKNF